MKISAILLFYIVGKNNHYLHFNFTFNLFGIIFDEAYIFCTTPLSQMYYRLKSAYLYDLEIVIVQALFLLHKVIDGK